MREKDEALSKALAAAHAFERQIAEDSATLSAHTGAQLPRDLLNARSFAVAAAIEAITAVSGRPGTASEPVSKRIALAASFLHGAPATEALILSGQYIKATAVLKQDLEILARIGNVIDGRARDGDTPHVGWLPEGLRRAYGPLNNVAHPSNEGLLHQFLATEGDLDAMSLAPTPKYHERAARSFYELHVFMYLELAHQLTLMLAELHNADDETWALARAHIDAGFVALHRSRHPVSAGR